MAVACETDLVALADMTQAIENVMRDSLPQEMKLVPECQTLRINMCVRPLAGFNYECSKIGTGPVTQSLTHEVWKGLWQNEQKVALKIKRGCRAEDTEFHRARYLRQISVWHSLNNKYTLPFLGTATDNGPFPYLASPWCSHGNARQFVREQKSKATCVQVCLEVTYGLRYLHTRREPIVHGALKGSNILISDEGHALLADFGIADFRGNRIIREDFIDEIARWTPPEHLCADKLTTEGDIWQWAMMSLELLSDKVPFFNAAWLVIVLHDLQRGARIDKDDYDSSLLDDEIWSLLSTCWIREPKKRPDIHRVVEKMETLSSHSSGDPSHMAVDI